MDNAQKYTSSTKQGSALRKVLGHSDNDNQLCFGGAVENRLPASITFKQSNGIEDSLAYMQLTGQRHIPNKGIIILFSSATVTIRGLQLAALFKELTLQRVSWIGLYGTPYEADKLDSSIVYIESIDVQYHNTDIGKQSTALEQTTFIRNGHANDEKSEE